MAAMAATDRATAHAVTPGREAGGTPGARGQPQRCQQDHPARVAQMGGRWGSLVAQGVRWCLSMPRPWPARRKKNRKADMASGSCGDFRGRVGNGALPVVGAWGVAVGRAARLAGVAGQGGGDAGATPRHPARRPRPGRLAGPAPPRSRSPAGSVAPRWADVVRALSTGSRAHAAAARAQHCRPAQAAGATAGPTPGQGFRWRRSRPARCLRAWQFQRQQPVAAKTPRKPWQTRQG